jgi:ABC-type transport system involved in multi-copper enzyme maturation permease subunit
MFNIAFNTFRELARNKILYLILFFGIVLIVFSLALASLSLWQTDKIMLDFWLAMIEMFGFISVIFIGSQLIFKEIEWKTIYLILSKPISRYQFILWKFFGFSMILACIVFFQSVIFWILVWYTKTPIDYLVPAAIVFIYLKLLLLFAVILFFSTFISSILSIVLTMLVYIIAHSLNTIIDMAHGKNIIMLNIGKFLLLIFPNFEALNIKSLIMSQVKISTSYIAFNFTYAIVYLILILTFTILIFNRKTFEN